MVLIAKDILEKEFLSMPEDTSLFQAAQQMKPARHGFVIVTDNARKPVGIVTEWDIVSKVVADGRDPKRVKLQEVMTRGLVTVDPSIGIDELSRFMAAKGIRRVLVVQDGVLLGIVTARSVLVALKDYVDNISNQIARLHMSPR